MKNTVRLMAGAVSLAVGAAVAAEKEDPVWTMEPRTPWLTPAREVMNLGGPGSDWKATYTRAIQGEFIKMAGSAKVHRWSDEPVDEAKAKWIPVNLPQTKFQATHWKLGVGYYERTVTLTKEQAARNVRISFETIGVHYRVWVNGQLAVGVPQSSSFLEQHDISAFVRPGENTLRISVGDKMGEDHSWIDWPLNHCPHGIVRPFYLEFREKVVTRLVDFRRDAFRRHNAVDGEACGIGLAARDKRGSGIAEEADLGEAPLRLRQDHERRELARVVLLLHRRDDGAEGRIGDRLDSRHMPRLHQVRRLLVPEVRMRHRPDDRVEVRALRELRQPLVDVETGVGLDRLQAVVVVMRRIRLRIERLQLRGSAPQPDLDDALGELPLLSSLGFVVRAHMR